MHTYISNLRESARVAQKSNVIEINGKRYDAVSGQLLGDAQAHATAATAKPVQTRSGSLDGVTKGATRTVAPAAKPRLVAAAPAQSEEVRVRPFSDFVRTPGQAVQRHKAVKSQTLMRSSVSKPAPSLKRHTKAHQRTDVLVKQPSITVKPKLSSYQLDQKRVARAKQTPRHHEVARYAAAQAALPSSASVKPITPQPTRQLAPVYAHTAAAVQPAPVRPAATAPQNRPMDIFEQALARANSQVAAPLPKRQARRRRAGFGARALSISAASLALLLVVGFVGWQQKASLTMHYAAAKAGVAASLPGYKPAGFKASNFTYSPGIVSVNFHNPNDGSSFALIEKSSGWDSQALRDSFVANQSKTYQTIDAAGRTIYTYGNNNATWVDNGVWYQVNSKGSLTTDQLVQLALSM